MNISVNSSSNSNIRVSLGIRLLRGLKILKLSLIFEFDEELTEIFKVEDEAQYLKSQ